jgi:septation ring formation regulator EzrA
MAEPKDVVIPMLREMRAEMRERFDAVAERFDDIDAKLEKIDARQKNFSNALTADTMTSKFITGDFEERIGALEKKMDDLLKTPRS